MAIYEKTKAKKIISDQRELKNIVSKTLDDMAILVGSTLGPGGRTVLIEREGMFPLCTKDGVTVAKSIGVPDSAANTVVEAAKEICLNTAKTAGDGTTTAIVLANALVKNGHSFIESNPKYNPQRIMNELQDCYNNVIVKNLKDKAVKSSTEEQLKNVAIISANGDTLIADTVVEAVLSAGKDGHILIEESQGSDMRVENIDGYIVTSGLKDISSIGHAFINDNANQQAKMEKGLIFLYDGTISDLKVPAILQNTIEASGKIVSSLLIFAHDFSDTVLDRFVKTTKGGVHIVPIKTPRSGLPNSRTLFLQDMSAYTGGTVYDASMLDSLENGAEVIEFGTFESAKANLFETTLFCNSDPAAIDSRVEELRSIMTSSYSEFDKFHIRAAIGKLTGGISTIWVGGTSDLEIREKKARVEDAVEAVRSAIAEGVVPGGATVHLMLADLIRNHPNYKESWSILANSLEVPFKQIMYNCGEDSEGVFNEIKLRNKDCKGLYNIIFDANKHEFVDPFHVGVLEPAKVLRVSIGNALSVSTLLFTLGGMVTVPYSAELEQQMELSKNMFNSMMKDT